MATGAAATRVLLPAARRGELLRSTPRAHEPVAHELLVLILGGHFAVGERLPSERQLATRFGVSRPTVREALSALEARGLVTARVGSGTFVAERNGVDESAHVATDDSPAEFMEARLVLEVAVARLAAKRAPLNPDCLGRGAGRASRPSAANPEELPDELDLAFHRAVVQLAGNAYLSALLEPIWETLRPGAGHDLAPAGLDARRHARASRPSTEPSSRRCGRATPSSRGSRWSATCAPSSHVLADAACDGPPPRFFA